MRGLVLRVRMKLGPMDRLFPWNHASSFVPDPSSLFPPQRFAPIYLGQHALACRSDGDV